MSTSAKSTGIDPASPRAKLDALVKLISSATQEAVAEYERNGHGAPSLDLSEAHPADTVPTSLALKKAIRTLEGACEQLCTTLAPPTHTIMNRSMCAFESVCMRIVIQANVADILLGHPEGLPVAEIATKAGLERGKLGRILRSLTTRNCFRETRPDVFANNRISLTLIRSTTADALLLNTGMTLSGVAALPETLRDPEYGPSYEPSKSAFMYSVKDENLTNYFEYLKVHPDNGKLFASAMIGWGTLTGGLSIVHDFPWQDLLPGTTICDVGGGVGDILMGLAKAHPHLKLTLQDTPTVIDKARDIWNVECSAAVAEQRVNFVPIDFFKDRPVNGLDIYYARHIIHDWPDASASTILQNIRQSMKPSSRLFIHEYILQSSHRQDSSATGNSQLAPYPLLPNYGAGNIRPYFLDVDMMVLMNAKERTLDEFKALGAQSGLQFVRVWELGEDGLVEFQAV